MTSTVNAQIAIQKLLQTKLEELRARNSAYSIRAFAKKLQTDSGALSGILNGKRPATRKFAIRVCERLALDPMERADLLRHFAKGKKGSPKQDSPVLASVQLSADQYHAISSWYHFGILSLMRTRGFKPDPAWIARRLGIRQMDARMALERLERLGVVTRAADGGLSRTQARIRTSDGPRSLSLQRAHAQNLQLAQASLERDPLEARDFTSITLPANPDKIPLARERIRAFLDEMEALLEDAPMTEVYKICVQMIPLTRALQEEPRESSTENDDENE